MKFKHVNIYSSQIFEYLPTQVILADDWENNGTFHSWSPNLHCKMKEDFQKFLVELFGPAVHIGTSPFGSVFTFRKEENVLRACMGDGGDNDMFDDEEYSPTVWNSIQFLGNDISLLEKVKEFCKKNAQKIRAKVVRGAVYYLAVTPAGPELLEANQTLNFGLVKTNYSDKIVEKHLDSVKNITKKNPRGKIVIYQGEPGGGKTYLVRHIISSIKNAYVVLLQPSMVASLADPRFIKCLMEVADDELPIVFILEDADEILAPRQAANMSGISTLLNLGDGILGSLLDTRIVCSTNSPMEQFDEAITRPGRLLNLITVENLSPDEANRAGHAILKDTSVSFEDCNTLAKVYARANETKERRAAERKAKKNEK